MDHLEIVHQTSLLESPQSRVLDISQAFISEQSQQWFVVHGHSQVRTSQDEVFCLLQCPTHSQTLALHRAVIFLSIPREPTVTECQSPPNLAAHWRDGSAAGTGFLQ